MTGEEVRDLAIKVERRKRWQQLRDDVDHLYTVAGGVRLYASVATVPEWARASVERAADSLKLAEVRLALSVLTNLVAPDPGTKILLAEAAKVRMRSAAEALRQRALFEGWGPQ